MNEHDPLEDFGARDRDARHQPARGAVRALGARRGFAVDRPSLFGLDGGLPGVEEGLQVVQRACVGAEFCALANKKGPNPSRPVTQ